MRTTSGIAAVLATTLLLSGCGGHRAQEQAQGSRQAIEAGPDSAASSGSTHRSRMTHARPAGTSAQPPYPRARPLPKDGHLPAERALLDSSRAALLGDQAGAVLESDEFDAFVQVLAEEMATDRDAGDLARFYDDQISDQLSNASALGALACGTSICIGSVRDSSAGKPGEAWADTFSRSPDTPHSSFIYAQVPLGGRNVETRFVIGTDPAFGGISFQAPKPGGD